MKHIASKEWNQNCYYFKSIVEARAWAKAQGMKLTKKAHSKIYNIIGAQGTWSANKRISGLDCPAGFSFEITQHYAFGK